MSLIASAIQTILDMVHGAAPAIRESGWRLFVLATAGLFGQHGSRDCGTGPHRLRPTQAV